MLSFKEWLKESKIMENGVMYFLLPINIVKKKIPLKSKKDKVLSVLQHELKVSEVLDCIHYFIDYCKRHDKSRFVLQTNRDVNKEFLEKANINPKTDEGLMKIFDIISELKVNDFDECSINSEIKSVAYIFKMKNYVKRLKLDESRFDNTISLYLKFQFLHSITHENGVTQYNHVRGNNNFLILVEPRQMIMNEISLHD